MLTSMSRSGAASCQATLASSRRSPGRACAASSASSARRALTSSRTSTEADLRRRCRFWRGLNLPALGACGAACVPARAAPVQRCALVRDLAGLSPSGSRARRHRSHGAAGARIRGARAHRSPRLGDALPAIAAARADGVRLTVETCPHYLTFAAAEIATAPRRSSARRRFATRAHRERSVAGAW